MPGNISLGRKQELLEKVLSCSPFSTSSETYANLLRYLFAESQTGNVPKEIDIAVEVFNRKNFIPSNSTFVRVYIYHLRKKLQEYYSGEGHDDAYQIKIPKGSYQLLWVNTPQEEVLTQPTDLLGGSAGKWRLVALALGATSLLLVVFLLLPNPRVTSSPPAFWETFVVSPNPKMIVLGDQFLFKEVDTLNGTIFTVRDPAINTLREFQRQRHRIERPHTLLSPRDYSYLVGSSSEWVSRLSALLGPQVPHEITLRSKLSIKDLRENNIVAAGMLKTLQPLFPLFDASRFRLFPDDSLCVQAPENPTDTCYRPSGRAGAYHTDYAYIARFAGPSDNQIILCSGLWDTGTSFAVQLLTDPKLIKEVEVALEADLGRIPDHFEALFLVRGGDRIELDHELIYLGELEAARIPW